MTTLTVPHRITAPSGDMSSLPPDLIRHAALAARFALEHPRPATLTIAAGTAISRTIGHACPPYIIAELGVNHDGSLDRALQLVDAAANAGADAIKVQVFSAHALMSQEAKLAAYQAAAGETDPIAMLARLELPLESMAIIIERAHHHGLHAIASIFSLEDIGPADRLPWDAFKTASPDIINQPLLTGLASTGKPLIISTGAATLEEVATAARWVKVCARGDGRPTDTFTQNRIAFLQCVSSYPTPLSSCEFGGIAALAALPELVGIPIGYSDHSDSTLAGALAMACGACILEKHFTFDRAAPGPDHRASLDPPSMAEYIRLARCSTFAPASSLSTADRVWLAARSAKTVLPIEEDVRRASRQSITSTRSLAAGHLLTSADLTLKRPGTGLAPSLLPTLVGRPLARSINADSLLHAADLSG